MNLIIPDNFRIYFLTTVISVLIISPCIASENEYKKWWSPLTNIKLKEQTYENSKRRKRLDQNILKPTQFILKKSIGKSNATPALNKRFRAFDKKRREYIFVKHTDVFPKWGGPITPENLIYSEAIEIKRRSFDENRRSSQRPFIIRTKPTKINFYDNSKKNPAAIPSKFIVKKKLENLTRRSKAKTINP